MENEEKLKKKIELILPLLNEQQKRLFLASEANYIGWGGISLISKLSNADRETISRGIKEIKDGIYAEGGESVLDGSASKRSGAKQRKKGGGRKPITEKDPEIIKALLDLVDKDSYGNPENPLRWTCKSTRVLAKELADQGHPISHNAVSDLLSAQGFTLQTNRKLMQSGKQHPDRNGQFTHINDTVLKYIKRNLPVISVDCKKKENIGEYYNGGAEFSEKGNPVKVLDHDFMDKEKGKVAPYGVYDIANNEGYVNVGISSDTAQFAVNSIRMWWKEMGKERFPTAKRLYVTADGGGSNGSRCRLWKVELQNLVNEIGIPIEVSHFPPGTSKWNKIEHRLFSWITKNWRGRPLVSLEVVVNLIASTTTEAGLTVKCGVDDTIYETGIKVGDNELGHVNIVRNPFHGEWNYIIAPHGENVAFI